MDMKGLHRIIKQLTNKVIDFKRSVGESFSLGKPLKAWNNKNINQQPPTPLIMNVIHFETYAMDNFWQDHHENHLEKTCKELKNIFKVFVSPPKEDKEEYDEE